MRQVLIFVLTCVRVEILLFFFPNGFSINFGLSLKSLDLFLVFVGSKSGSTEVQLHHKLHVFFNRLVHLWSWLQCLEDRDVQHNKEFKLWFTLRGLCFRWLSPQNLALLLCNQIKSWKTIQCLFSSFFTWERAAQQALLSFGLEGKGCKSTQRTAKGLDICLSGKEGSWSDTCSYSMWTSLVFFSNFVDLIPQAVVL